MKSAQSRCKAAPVDMTLHHTIFRNVPDEVMENILSYHITIPFSLFCSPRQHFGKYDLSDSSSSVVLEVCRRWMRIGTPLLYETVILRSQAQILALRASLDANPALCKHVKKLRVEHTSGMAIADVMQICTAVTDLWVSLRLQSGDRDAGKGIMKGMKFLDPKHVILCDYSMSYGGPHKPRLALFNALPEVLRNWKKLSTLRYLSEPGPIDGHCAETIVSKLHELCPLLEYLYLTDSSFTASPSLLSAFSRIKTLKNIWILEGTAMSSLGVTGLSEATLESYKNLLKKAAIYRPFSAQPPIRQVAFQASSLSCATVDIVALQAADPRRRASILLNILRHCLELPELPHRRTLGLWRTPILRTMSQISRDFRNAAVPFLYSDIELITHSQCKALEHILATSDHGRHVRHIKGDVSVLLSMPEFHNILRRSTWLMTLQKMPWGTQSLNVDDLSVISILVGKTLRYLDFSIVDSTDSFLSWNYFNPVRHRQPLDWSSLAVSLSGLRYLTAIFWSSDADFDIETLDTRCHPNSLPHLKHLTYDSTRSTLLSFLSQLELPNLIRVVVTKPLNIDTLQNFLRLHGQKLTHLNVPSTLCILRIITEHCPNVSSLKIRAKRGSLFSGNRLLESFRELKPNGALLDLCINIEDVYNDWEEELRCLQGADFSLLMALRNVYLPTYQWPTEESAISKSSAVALAERLWLERKVRTVDKNGTAWKPRLKVTTSTRRKTSKKQLASLT